MDEKDKENKDTELDGESNESSEEGEEDNYMVVGMCLGMCLIGLMGPVFDIGVLWFIAVTGYGLGTPIICIELISLYKK